MKNHVGTLNHEPAPSSRIAWVDDARVWMSRVLHRTCCFDLFFPWIFVFGHMLQLCPLKLHLRKHPALYPVENMTPQPLVRPDWHPSCVLSLQLRTRTAMRCRVLPEHGKFHHQERPHVPPCGGGQVGVQGESEQWSVKLTPSMASPGEGLPRAVAWRAVREGRHGEAPGVVQPPPPRHR